MDKFSLVSWGIIIGTCISSLIYVYMMKDDDPDDNSLED